MATRTRSDLVAAPAYDPVATTEQEVDHGQGPPPSYFNVFSQLKVAKVESKSPHELGKKTVLIIINSVCFSGFEFLLTLWQIALIIIGFFYINDCTIQDKIPIWLIIYGITGVISFLIRVFLNISRYLKYEKQEKVSRPLILSCLESLFVIFSLIWFITGNVWVYGIFDQVRFDRMLYPQHYCDRFCYYVTFGTITGIWILIGLFCCFVCFGVCLATLLCTAAAKSTSDV